MIYTDGIHLISDVSLQDMHAFAQKAGIPEERFRPHRRHPHYRLEQATEIRAALCAGAEGVSSRGIVKVLRNTRGARHD